MTPAAAMHPTTAVVADRLQIKPRLRSVHREGGYQVLALTLTEAKLYEGTRRPVAH